MWTVVTVSELGSVTKLLDKQAIYEVVLRYCRGVDRLDIELVRSAYHPGAVDHHVGFEGNIDEYAAWLERVLAKLDGTMHLVGNHYVEFVDDDRAISETYVIATHWGTPSDDGLINFTGGGRYVDVMERRNGVWAIAERWAVQEWSRSDAGTVTMPRVPGARGSRDNTDPLHQVLARARRTK